MRWLSYLYLLNRLAMNTPLRLLLVILLLATRSSIAQSTAILGAYGEEITLLLEKVQDKKDSVIAGLHFTEGTLNGRKVVVALTGIGKVNAAITTTLMIEHFHPAELLFSGIAGGVDPALSPGDLVIGKELAYHDYGLLADTFKLDSTRDP